MTFHLPGYAIGQRLGSGATGTVYRACQDGPAQRAVAVKRLAIADDPQRVARIRQEGEMLAALDHPHIVAVHELVGDGDGVAIVMQYAPGGCLAERLLDRGQMTAAEVVAIAAPVADALACAHGNGVLHRDVKPSNIFFADDDHPLLGDFGAALWDRARHAGDTRRLTATGASLGTAEYLDPTVADGAPATARSDVYSLGVVCYELLTATIPFQGPTPLAVLKAADTGVFIPILELAPDTDPRLARTVETAMARDPEARYADAATFAAALRGECVASPAALPSAHPTTAPQRLTRQFGPRPPRPSDTPQVRAVPKTLVATLALVLLLAPFGIVQLRGGQASRQVGPAATVTPRQPAATCTPAVAAPQPDDQGQLQVRAQGQVVEIDLGGAGCTTPAVWDGNVLSVVRRPGEAPVRYALGQPGDELLVGNWDCAAGENVALYRPSTGEVFMFRGWASATDPLVSVRGYATGVTNGAPLVADTDGDGCDEVAVAQRTV